MSRIEMVPLMRSILVTIPVRVCWANADVPAMPTAAMATMIFPAIFMKYSRLQSLIGNAATCIPLRQTINAFARKSRSNEEMSHDAMPHHDLGV
jgi:hypothetical protein